MKTAAARQENGSHRRRALWRAPVRLFGGGRQGRGRVLAAVLFGIMLGAQPYLQADNAVRRVAAGNAAYAAGEYEKALSLYEEAAVDRPEAPVLPFNKGAVYYQMNELDKAQEAFEQAVAQAPDPQFEAAAKYNLGNCAFRESERWRDNDLNASLTACETSIRRYREALDLDPGLTAAARNLEVARLALKSILDAQKQEKEEGERQQQQQQKQNEELQELARRQEEAADRSRELAGAQETPARDAAGRELGTTQQELGAETKAVAQRMKNAADIPDTPASGAAPEQPLDAAVAAQEQALRELDGQQFEEAAGSQQTAAQEIRKLLESEPAPAADDTDDAATDTNPETSDKDAAAGGDKESQEGPAPEPDAAAAAEPADETPALSTGEDPRDILDEERQQRVRRQQRQRRLRPVERDW